MPNPNHTPRVEASLIILEAIKRQYGAIVNGGGLIADCTPAYRRDVVNELGVRYNAMCERAKVDYLPLRTDFTTEDLSL